MPHTYKLIIYDNITDKEYIFDGYFEKDEQGCIYIYICHIIGTTIQSGVCLFYDREDTACMIDITIYAQTDMKIEHKERISDILIKGSLKYLIENYNTIEYVSFQDGAKIKETDVLITPKFLLLGKSSWYSFIFGAKSAIHNVMIEKWLSKNRENMNIKEDILKPEWGKAEDYSEELSKLLVTRWFIEKKTIENYPVTIKVCNLCNIETNEIDWIKAVKIEETKQQDILGYLRNLKTKWYIEQHLRDYNLYH